MAIQQLPVYTGEIPALGQEQSRFNANVSDKLAYDAILVPAQNVYAEEANALAESFGLPRTLAVIEATEGQTQFFVGAGLSRVSVNRDGTQPFDDTFSYNDLTGYVSIIGKGLPVEAGEKFQFGVNLIPASSVPPSEDPVKVITMNRPKVPSFVAHRGLSSSAPENTVAAFELAGRSGFWGCECDVRLTSDSAWVVMHDETVDRTTNGSGDVASKTLAQMKALDAGSWFDPYFSDLKVPTVTEYLLTCRKFGMTANIEIKSASPSLNQLEDLIGLCVKVMPEYQFTIQSTDPLVLTVLRTISKDIFLAYTVGDYQDSYVDKCKELEPCTLTLVYTAIPTDAAYARSKGVLISAWTINDYDALSIAVERGATEIISNYISE